MKGRAAFLFAIAALPPAAEAQQARPLLRPTRDVEVVYDMAQGDRHVQERTRWQGSTGLERLDTPAGGQRYAIADQTAGTVNLVNDAASVVMTMPTPRGPLNGGAALFHRLGTMTVAGLNCTEWQVTPPARGTEVDQICLTDDGVLLNIRVGDVQRARAASVRYGALDAALFTVPATYRHVQPPSRPVPSPVPTTP